MTPIRLPIGLCAYAIPYSIGFVGRGTPRALPNPLTGYDLLDLAQRMGLAAIELPAQLASTGGQPLGATQLDAFRQAVEERGLALTVDTPPLDAAAMAAELRTAHRLGARVVRTMLSFVLCGDRAPVGGYDGWQRLLEERITTLKQVAPLAEELDIRIGIENHQDATSVELVELCQAVDSTHVGITLDTGNPLAVAEDPVSFARNILPHLVHVHLKDYRVARTAPGYRLYHCPIGAGVVDFAALFALFQSRADSLAHPLAMNLEMAMLGERHIRILADDYWAGFGPRAVADLLPILRFRDMAPPEDDIDPAELNTLWRTPWDTGDDERISAWELDRLAQSAANMHGLLETTPA